MNFRAILPKNKVTEVHYGDYAKHPGVGYGPPPIKELNMHVEEMNKQNWELVRVEGDPFCRWICLWQECTKVIRD